MPDLFNIFRITIDPGCRGLCIMISGHSMHDVQLIFKASCLGMELYTRQSIKE